MKKIPGTWYQLVPVSTIVKICPAFVRNEDALPNIADRQHGTLKHKRKYPWSHVCTDNTAVPLLLVPLLAKLRARCAEQAVRVLLVYFIPQVLIVAVQ